MDIINLFNIFVQWFYLSVSHLSLFSLRMHQQHITVLTGTLPVLRSVLLWLPKGDSWLLNILLNTAFHWPPSLYISLFLSVSTFMRLRYKLISSQRLFFETLFRSIITSSFIIRLINRYFSLPLNLSSLAWLMGLTPHYSLIPKHTARWRKACSHLQCRRECLCMPVNHPGRFSGCCVSASMPGLGVWIPHRCCYRRHCGYLLSHIGLLLLCPFFMYPHLSMTSSITTRVTAPWRQFVSEFLFSVVQLVRAGLCGCGWMTEHVEVV